MWKNVSRTYCGDIGPYHPKISARESTAEKLVAACRDCGISTVNICEKFLNESFLSVMKKNGIGISAWTVNEPVRIRQLLGMGIRNITTRNLKEALMLRREGKAL